MQKLSREEERAKLNEVLRDKFPIKLAFDYYYKYEFGWSNYDNPSFKVRAWYSGMDRIYRLRVNNNEYVTIDSLEDFERQFTGVEILNYTNECIYFWEDIE